MGLFDRWKGLPKRPIHQEKEQIKMPFEYEKELSQRQAALTLPIEMKQTTMGQEKRILMAPEIRKPRIKEPIGQKETQPFLTQ